MTFSQTGLDSGLLFQEPVHGRIEIVIVNSFKAKLTRQRGGLPKADSGELGMRLQNTGRDHGQDLVTLRTRLGVDQFRHFQTAHGFQHGVDVAVCFGVDDIESLAWRNESFALQVASPQVDEAGVEVGKVGQGAFFDLTVFVAIGFTQQDGGWGIAVWYGFDIHGLIIAVLFPKVKIFITNYMATILGTNYNFY